EIDRTTVDACEQALEFPGSVGLVVADSRVSVAAATLRKRGVPHVLLTADDDTDDGTDDVDARLTLVPASMAKGLEFDHVVLVEPSDIAAHDDVDPRFGLRQLYIALTRAVSGLIVV